MKLLVLRSYVLETKCIKAASGGQDKVFTTFVASSDIEDRYGDIIDQTSWKLDNFQKNPVIPIDHYYSVEAVVGRASSLTVKDIAVEGGGTRKALFVVVEWDIGSKMGAEVAGKVERGFINAVSVGFRSNKTTLRSRLPKEDPYYGPDGYVLEENELYEISVVAVPANPEAIAQRQAQAGGAVDAAKIVEETLLRLCTDDALWKKVEAKRLAAKSLAGEGASEPEDQPYWLR